MLPIMLGIVPVTNRIQDTDEKCIILIFNSGCLPYANNIRK